MRSPGRLTPDDFRLLIFRKFNRVYDVNLRERPGGRFFLEITSSTDLPEKDTKAYMTKLADISAAINAWGVVNILKDAIQDVDLKTSENSENSKNSETRILIEIDLHVTTARINEFNCS
jgi:hypothetical protein